MPGRPTVAARASESKRVHKKALKRACLTAPTRAYVTADVRACAHASMRLLRRWQLLALALLFPCVLMAGPFAPPGDLGLRHDVQQLADAGVLDLPVSTWPLAWGDLAAAVDEVRSEESLGPSVLASLARLRERVAEETQSGELVGELVANGDTMPARVRRFADTPRAKGELGAALSWTGMRFAMRLEGRVVAEPEDGKRARADGSFVGVVLGNWSLSLGQQAHWWGPGYDGSLILSNNARPVPGVMLKRIRSLRFSSKWLSWTGPWTASFFAGQLESQRAVPDANLLGARVAFRPARGLEIGLSRTAQWCGEGRPCGLRSFWDMLTGNDNSGADDDLEREQEPGNQLAGVDLRYAGSLADRPVAIYGQFIGEDEAGGLPSRFLGQLGVETWGELGRDGAGYRLSLEYADTACDFPGGERGFNCAYGNSLYPSGYRYRGRALGHPMDGDGRMLSLRGLLAESDGSLWTLTLRIADLNRGGETDFNHSVTPQPARYRDVELRHSRRLRYGSLEGGLGLERFEPEGGDAAQTDARLFVQWRSR